MEEDSSSASDISDGEESSSEDIVPETAPATTKPRPGVARPVVPDSDDEDDSSDDGAGGFLGIVRGIQARARKSDTAEAGAATKEAAPKRKPAMKRDEAEDLERDRKETARRTLELMEARRMVEVAMEGENAKKKHRKRNSVNKRCNVHLVRQRMDEELAAQERGPRYVNNVAVFVKKGQKDIDANEAEVLVKKDEKEKAKKAKEKEDKQKAS